MEKQPDIIQKYDGVQVELTVLSYFEEKDVCLSALRKQLEEQIIDLEAYKERREAYLRTFLPDSVA